MSENKTYLRFECGARLPEKGYLKDPWSASFHTPDGPSHIRKDGRGRLLVYYTSSAHRQTQRPRMPDGKPSPCLFDCPAKRKSGRKMDRCFPEPMPGPGEHIKFDYAVTCYPEEVLDA